MVDRVEREFKNVRLERRIGRGGMAEVYLGVHRTLERRVAVKFLHAHLVAEEEIRRRFLAEAKSVAALRHPNIVEVYDFDVLDGRPYIIMQYVEGPSLAHHLARLHTAGRRLPLSAVLHLISMVASALDFAHSQGIVHRDVNPANILLTSSGSQLQPGGPLPKDVTAVLTDFGVARIAHASTATATGTILGTPAYMAPEQVVGGEVDARTDLYAMGVMLYEMLAGQRPFDVGDDGPAVVLFKHVHEPVPPLDRRPDGLQAVIARALAKDQSDRYMTAGELLRDLKRTASGGDPAPVTQSRERSQIRRTNRRREARSKQGAPDGRLPLSRRWRWAAIGLLVLLVVGAGLAGALALDPLGTATGGASTSEAKEGGIDLAARASSTPSPTAAASNTTSGDRDPAGGVTVGAPAATESGQEPTQSSPSTATPPPPTPSNTPRPSATPSPTIEPSPTATPTPIPPTATRTPSRTPAPTSTPTEKPTEKPTGKPTEILPLPSLDVSG